MTEKIKVVLRGLSYQKIFPDFPEAHPGENQKPKFYSQICGNILFVYYFKDIYFSYQYTYKGEVKFTIGLHAHLIVISIFIIQHGSPL